MLMRGPGEDERQALVDALDRQRHALMTAARRTSPLRSSSAAALVLHAARWEERWFQGIVTGRFSCDGWPADASSLREKGPVGDPDVTLSDAVAQYETAILASRPIVAAMRLEHACARADLIAADLRWVLQHLADRTARWVEQAASGQVQ